MKNTEENSSLAPLRKDLAPEKRTFAESLRTMFLGLGLSVRRYAGRYHSSPGTVTRYLNGSRVPEWEFVSALLSAASETTGQPVTPDVEMELRKQHKDAQQAHKPLNELQKLEEQLATADALTRRLQVQENALAARLLDREQELEKVRGQHKTSEVELAELQQAHTGAVVRWEQLHDQMYGHCAALEDEVARLRAAIIGVQQQRSAAEERCSQLEQRLAAAEELLAQGISGASLMEVLEAADRSASIPELLQLVGGLVTNTRLATAGDLVTSVLRCRPVGDVQALLFGLYQAGLGKYADAALPAMVAIRSVDDIAVLVSELSFSGLQDPLVPVLRASVELHTPHDLAKLAATLHRSGLDDAVLVVLSAAAASRPVDDVVTMYSALAESPPLQCLVESLEHVTQERGCQDLVLLVLACHEANLPHIAQAFQSAMALQRSATDVAELMGALNDRGRAADFDAVFQTTQQRSPAHLVALVSALQAADLHVAASKVFPQVLSTRPVQEVAKVIADFHLAGRYQQAADTLTIGLCSLPTRQTGNLIECLDALPTMGMNGSLRLVAEAAAQCSAPHAAQMVSALFDCALRDHAMAVWWNTITTRPTGHAGAVLRSLQVRESRHVLPEGIWKEENHDLDPGAPEIAALCRALYEAKLEPHLDRVIMERFVNRPAPEAALLLKNILQPSTSRGALPAADTPRQVHAKSLADRMLTILAERCSARILLEHYQALVSLGLPDSAHRLESLASVQPLGEFAVTLVVWRTKGKQVRMHRLRWMYWMPRLMLRHRFARQRTSARTPPSASPINMSQHPYNPTDDPAWGNLDSLLVKPSGPLVQSAGLPNWPPFDSHDGI
jgi:transcriptional regulator with XRE-family HTH domain